MSSSRLPLVPDPGRWVSASKAEKGSIQRPLVGMGARVHHGIATPPSTVSKRQPPVGSARKRRAPVVTPIASSTKGIESYLTPPTTGTALSKARSRRNTRSPSKDGVVDVSMWMADVTRSQQPIAFVPSLGIAGSKTRHGNAGTRTTTAGPSRLSFSPPAGMESLDRLLGVHNPSASQDEVPRFLADIEASSKPTGSVTPSRTRRREQSEAAKENGSAKRPRAHRVLGNFKSHEISSSERSSSPSPPSERIPLQNKNINTLRRHTSATEQRASPRDIKWPKPPPKATIPSAFPSRQRLSQLSPSPDRTPRKTGHTTPRKRHTAHHQVTPPKSRSPQQCREVQETLFEFPPSRPRQPVFERVSPVKEWQPVDMEPETLMTWSLGGVAAKSMGGLQNIQEVASDIDETESIAPSVPSQSFPILVESSSPKKALTKAQSPPHEVITSDTSRESPIPFAPSSPSPLPSPQPACSSRSTSPRKLVRHAERPRNIQHALFSSLSDGDALNSAAASYPFPLPSQNSRTPRPKPKPAHGQTKLEAFGYFRSTPRPSREAEFELDFSEEEDLDFGEELPASSPPPASDLRRVPEAPPHPSLRPAGIRELARREQEAMDRHLAQLPPSSPNSSGSLRLSFPDATDAHLSDGITDLSSSVTDDPRISESTRAWLERLGGSDGLPSL